MATHKTPFVTVDGVLVERGKVLLVKRNHPPFEGYWVFPGGHVDYGETVEEAVVREMAEEIGVEVKIEELIDVYSDPAADPRGHRVTIAYLLKRVHGEITIDREASEFKWFSLNRLPSKIGFDHRVILHDVKKS